MSATVAGWDRSSPAVVLLLETVVEDAPVWQACRSVPKRRLRELRFGQHRHYALPDDARDLSTLLQKAD